MSCEPTPRPTKGRVNSIDCLIGARLRAKRKARGLTQADLAHALGISFQQLQKYEGGKDRISASRLFEAACVLGVKIGWFLPNSRKMEDQPSPSAAPFSL